MSRSLDVTFYFPRAIRAGNPRFKKLLPAYFGQPEFRSVDYIAISKSNTNVERRHINFLQGFHGRDEQFLELLPPLITTTRTESACP